MQELLKFPNQCSKRTIVHLLLDYLALEMNTLKFFRFQTPIFLGFLVVMFAISGFTTLPHQNDNIIYHISDPKNENIRLYWKDDQNNMLLSLSNLKNYVEQKNQNLIMAMIGGMYQVDHKPVGLYIENGEVIKKLNQADARGNFYLKPNGVFYLTKNQQGTICTTENYQTNKDILWATQSGPMLVIDGKIHSEFRQGSANLNIRNGVGILSDGKIIFAISKIPINFYDFAIFFQEMGCKNALYLDGSASKMYLPSKNKMDLDGDFGVMIGITSK